MNRSLIYWPHFYDIIIRILIEAVTYILFVSNSDVVELLLNSMGILFLANVDKFFSGLISRRLTVSLLREYIF